MSIPLDRFYNFVDSLSGGDIIIYRFYPHGSKKITDLEPLRLYPGETPYHDHMICHDQEPLDFEAYHGYKNIEFWKKHWQKNISTHWISTVPPRNLERKRSLLENLNLKLALKPSATLNPVMLLHSERRSSNLERYRQAGFVPVYMWSHGIIARDWFRYAELDPDLDYHCEGQKFLIYNRAWSGSREYRLKFTEMLLQYQLQDKVRMKFNPEDSDKDYRDHVFSNPNLQISRHDLEQHWDTNLTPASASADYVASDYQHTDIEIVLETLFDDSRLHLTEKALRPIACAQPFLLVGTAKSLSYLKSYGFESFSPWINENYDDITDPLHRLQAIADEMLRISNLPKEEYAQLVTQTRLIAKRNQVYFFSKEFHHTLVNEFQENFRDAMAHLNTI